MVKYRFQIHRPKNQRGGGVDGHAVGDLEVRHTSSGQTLDVHSRYQTRPAAKGIYTCIWLGMILEEGSE